MKAVLLIALMTVPVFSAWPIDSVLSRADSCIQVEWKPTTANTDLTWYGDNGAKCTGSSAKYQECDFLPGTVYHGIAYSYGGEDTPKQFLQKVDLGLAVGSHLCHYQTFGDPSPAVAGTDCSGFLCWVWKTPRLGTTGLIQKFPVVSRSEVRAGDALVKSGNHCVLVAEMIDEKKAVIMESTSAVNSCRERIVDITDSYWSTYTPIRNPDIGDETSVASKGNTRSVSPYLSGNTVVAGDIAEPFTVTICSANGRILRRDHYPSETKTAAIPVEKLGGGIYIIRVQSTGIDHSLRLTR